MTKLYTCICCPNGCDITVELDNGSLVSFSGNKCKKGEDYIRQELTSLTAQSHPRFLSRTGKCRLHL